VPEATERPDEEPGAGESTEELSTARSDTLSQAWTALVAASRILVPSTFLASLFFYFGWRYTREYFWLYGLDVGGLGFSTTDYVMVSPNVFVEPVREVALAVIVGIGLHVALTTALRLANRTWPGLGDVLARILGAVLVVAGTAGLLLLWSPDRVDVESTTRAATWLVSVLVVIYGVYLGWVRGRPADQISRFVRDSIDGHERRIVVSLLLAMAILLVAKGAFDLTGSYATDRAIEQATGTDHRSRNFPLVRIYGKYDLALDDLDVPEEVLPGEEGAYRYRYVDLRLFLQQNDHLVLWPADRCPRSGMFVLRESDDLYVQYEPALSGTTTDQDPGVGVTMQPCPDASPP
jgi:hypothetical protein